MSEMTPRERVMAAMNLEDLDRPPVAIFTQSATVGMMDKCGAAWPDAYRDPQLMATLAAAQADVFGFECARASFCLTVEAERLGCGVAIEKKDSTPMIKNHPCKFECVEGVFDDPADLVPVEEFLDGGRVGVVVEACEILKKEKGDTLPIVAGTTGPFTIAGHMVSTENIIFGMMMAPEEVDKWVAAMAPYCNTYSKALIEAGADIIQMSEPSASTDMIAPDTFVEASGNAINASFKGVPGMSVLHICGNTYPILDHMCGLDVTGLSIEEKVDPYEAVEKVDGRRSLVGNVGSVKPMFQGKPEEIEDAAFASCDAGFNIISTGCGIASMTPDENCRIMVETVKNFRRRDAII